MALDPVKRLPAGNDPRLGRAPDDLAAATRSAMPQVAKSGGDALGLALGMIGCAAIGAFTLISLHNAPKPVAPPRPVPPPPVRPLAPLPAPQAAVRPPQSLLQLPPVTVAPVPTPVQDLSAARAPAMIIDNSTPAPAAAAQASPDVRFAAAAPRRAQVPVAARCAG